MSSVRLWLTAASLLAVVGLAPGVAPAETIYAVTTANSLLLFDSATPGTIISNLAITGLQAGEQLLGIDFRPATGQLFGVGSTSRLYLLEPRTGVATQVGSGTFAVPLSGTSFGMDFNPVPDRIRVVSNTGQNLRLNPNNGTIAGVDTPLNPGTPAVVGAAYDRSFEGAPLTTLLGIDLVTDQLVRQGGVDGTPSPNGGTLTTIGSLGVVTANTNNGFDIAPGSGTAFAALPVGASYDPGFTGGVRVATGDINGDRVADIITGAGPGGGPHVRALSGVNLTELRSFFAFDPAFTGGVFVAAGDVNGDGVRDIITGVGEGGGPFVLVFNGKDGSLLRGLVAYNPAFTGGARVGAAPLGAHGTDDILTVPGPGGGSHVRGFDGATLADLQGFLAYPGFFGGVFVTGDRY